MKIKINNFNNFNLNNEIKLFNKYNTSSYKKKEEKLPIDLFYFVSRAVPAYKDFLIKNNIDISSIKKKNDLKKIPITTRDNYLRKYKYTDLFPKKDIQSSITFSATSGSTGESFYFPRLEIHDQKYELALRLLFKNQFETKKKNSLVIMGFGLGVWIGGLMTYKVLYQLAINNHKISIVPTGPNREQFLMAIKKFGHLYDQIILMGYPPFIKDIIDESKSYGINWNNYSIKIFTAAEGYSEKFREYLINKTFLKNRFSDIVNLYGTVEMGVMGHETALSNLIRFIAVNNKKVFKELFGDIANIPTLVQYYPHIIHFEEVNKKIIASAYGSSIPLIRYNFSDLGGVISFDKMKDKLKSVGIDINKEAKKYKIDKKILKLPFVWVYARSDFAVVFRGANVFPEEIKNALIDKNITNFITGRFTMIRKEDKKLSQILEINIELKKNIKSTKKIADNIQKIIINELCAKNSEFNNEYISHPRKATPKIVLHEYGNKKYFGREGKQKWVDKQ